MIEDESASIKLDNFDETLHLNHRLPSAHKINHERDFKYFGKETESIETSNQSQVDENEPIEIVISSKFAKPAKLNELSINEYKTSGDCSAREANLYKDHSIISS